MADLVERYGRADVRDKVETGEALVKHIDAGHELESDDIGELVQYVAKDLTSMNFKVSWLPPRPLLSHVFAASVTAEPVVASAYVQHINGYHAPHPHQLPPPTSYYLCPRSSDVMNAVQVCLTAIQLVDSLVKRYQRSFAHHIDTVMPGLRERLGDSKDEVCPARTSERADRGEQGQARDRCRQRCTQTDGQSEIRCLCGIVLHTHIHTHSAGAILMLFCLTFI